MYDVRYSSTQVVHGNIYLQVSLNADEVPPCSSTARCWEGCTDLAVRWKRNMIDAYIVRDW